MSSRLFHVYFRLFAKGQSPTRWRSRSKLPELEFEVVIRLPKSKSKEPFRIASLETNMPNFSHHIDDLADQIVFGNLSLRSANSHIAAQVRL